MKPVTQSRINDMTIKTQQDNVEIGEYAIVRCITVQIYSYVERSFIIAANVPVFPYPAHEDNEIIKFPEVHRHYDYRFWSSDMITDHISLLLLDSWTDLPSMIALESDIIDEYDRVLVCTREVIFLGEDYSFLPDLEKAYADQFLIDENICPHRGFKVFPDRQANESCKTCPGHGLRFDSRGKVLKRD